MDDNQITGELTGYCNTEIAEIFLGRIGRLCHLVKGHNIDHMHSIEKTLRI